MISALLISVLMQAPQPPKDHHSLPVTTKPLVPLPLFAAQKAVSVSEFYGRAAGINRAIRVYRYTYTADFEKERQRFKATFSSKDRWKIHQDDPKQLVMTREIDHPKLREQALILHPGKLVAASGYPGARPIAEPGYVWISFNEMFKK